MTQRNAKPSENEKEVPVNLFERYGLRARVSEHPRACGHTGHFVDLDMFIEPENEWLSFGIVSDTVLQDTIILLQEAQEYIGTLNGVRLLPTVRFGGKTYFLDGRLSELRNVDDPHDRVKLVAVL